MPTLVIATHNPAKFREISEHLVQLQEKGITLQSLHDLGVDEEPEETGTTIEENAILKATFYAEKTHLPTLSDDSGFHIDALNGEPGVLSKKWLGRPATDQELIDHTMERMKDVPEGKRSATLDTVICLHDPETDTTVCETGSIEGTIPEKPHPKLEKGFPFRPVFIVKKYNKFYEELTEEEHQNVNQRLSALKKILPKVEKTLVE
jgi:XTP/dITP diphosphohydrolase